MSRKRVLDLPEGGLFVQKEPLACSQKPGIQENSAGLDAVPLASRMRPRQLDALIGQEHILAPNSLLRKAIEADRLASVVFFGPPGTGKTTLAHCIAATTNAFFEPLNAVSSNVEEMRKVIRQAKLRRSAVGRKTILFIDEIHRFSKAQQDVLMPDIEDGSVTLIGATVQNPCFALTSPLLSRSLLFEFRPLSQECIVKILARALADKERGLGGLNVVADDDALAFLAQVCEGDARRALNALEIGVKTKPRRAKERSRFTLQDAQESIQKKVVLYDRAEDGHHDTISAFIKSMRGSDPDATLYWLAKMLYAGEDPRFISRRICICAAEDVGNADPQALVLAHAAFGITEFVGLPEARIPLAQAAVYVACAPKSNAVYKGIEKASKKVREARLQDVPTPLKGAGYAGARKLGRGQGYKYPHDFEGHYTPQAYMSEAMKFYEPTQNGYEKRIRERLERLKEVGEA